MAATHTVRVPQTSSTPLSAAPASSTKATAADRVLWLEVTAASVLGATGAVLATWAILATQTLQMHI
jgi:hypothetical protein